MGMAAERCAGGKRRSARCDGGGRSGAGRRGATLAVHSLAGFGGAAMGPLVLGIVLDLGGGMANIAAWGLAFASVGVIGLLGPVVILVLRNRRD